MVTLYGREFWVQATGKPVYNEEQQIIGIRGVIQNIDDNKSNEFNLQNSLDIIAAQNSRLFNFAHVVSHNLRSHSSNLSLVVQLLNEAKNAQDKIDLIENVEDISENLDIAISRLNDMFAHQNLLKKDRTIVSFKQSLDIVISSVSSLIELKKFEKIFDRVANVKNALLLQFPFC